MSCVCSVVGMIVGLWGARTRMPVSLYCNYLMVWVMVVLLVVLTEHILLGESCVCDFFPPVCFSWGLFMKFDRRFFLKRTIISFKVQCFSLLVFPEWAGFCCCFSSSMRVKRVPWKSLWPVWTPLLYVVFPLLYVVLPLFSVSAILWTCLDV